uniref:CRAL-TRIO domain-containing protein n=1 Tax=Corethron hystrix TaxID=216773 RepID=A0A7S1C136_9STRA|mmetsp:Transcript_812/g.1646  ORF Transcript_812/g.1646 Transcript_812/m.1646 type:complete len:328 (+) Transcript_812:378-1361(+)
MIDTAVSLRKEAAVHSFYPNPRDALGCSASAFLSQYPQLYAGRAKIGCPLHISCPGKLNLDGLQALTTIDHMLRFQWHSMVHVFGGNLRSCAKEFEGFKRYQVVSILDLDGVSISMINSTVLGIIKRQAHVDSFCFPETLNRLIIVNAPYFFSVTWKIIKGWIDQRTASKIEIISSADKSKATARLLELVDEEKLVTDYGGSYASLIELILNFENNMRSSKKDQFAKIDRRLTHVMHMHSRALSYSIPLNQGEAMDITILSQNGNAGEAIAAFEIVSPDGTQRCTEEYFTRDSQNPLTTELVLGKNIRGEGKVRLYYHLALATSSVV